ncbi:MAG: hypothetical protein WA982_12140, partial [Rubrobacteraceae bacterium]
ILVSDTGGLIPVLESFYAALSLSFSKGSVADINASVPQVVDALSTEVRRRYGATEASLDEDLLSRAQLMRGAWRASPR